MPKTIVEIEWDSPDDTPYWLCGDNIAIALHAYCKNTNFKVKEVNLLEYNKLTDALGTIASTAVIPLPFTDWKKIAQLLQKHAREALSSIPQGNNK